MKSPSTTMFATAAASLLLYSFGAIAGEKVLYSFCAQQGCADGETPYASLLRVKGELYATTTSGGANQWGTLVDINRKTATATVLYSFESYFEDAAGPQAAVIRVNGKLYGTTADGGAGYNGNGAGTLYAANPRKGTMDLAYSFCSKTNCADGALPVSELMEMNGLLYGTTISGGGSTQGCLGPYPACGTVFSFDPASHKEKVVYGFCASNACPDGSKPAGDVIAINGVLYGTTSEGGGGVGCSDMGLGCGIVFSLDSTTGAETVLHTFGGDLDGGTPYAGLIDVNGTLYGTTAYGGSYATSCSYETGCGTVFSIDPATGAETVVHAFQDDGKDGESPMAGLINVNGTLYGTTQYGGAHGYGVVIAIDVATGKENVVYSFCKQQGCVDGANPVAGLTEINGKLYGTTSYGGANKPPYGGGTVFVITP